MDTYQIKNYILAFIKQSQAFKDNSNIDALIDENLQEMGFLNNGIIALTEATKATNATIVALQKAFGFLNYAFVDIDKLQAQIEVYENQKALAETQRDRRSELDNFLSGLDPEMLLTEIINNQ